MAIKLGAKHGRNSSFHRYADVLDTGSAFMTSGALRGGPWSGGGYGLSGWDAGRLPREWWEDVSRADYIVWSYDTPIAWRIPGEGWVVPDVSYSVTTSCHQGKIRAALGMIGGYRKTPETPDA